MKQTQNLSALLKSKEQGVNLARLAPHNATVEQAVIGAMLLETEKQELVFEVIHQPEIFYDSVNKLIFQAMKSLFDKGDVIDLVTVTNHLRKLNHLEFVGGEYHVTNLALAVASSAHVETHSRMLVEMYMRRELAKLSAVSQDSSYDETLDVFEIIDYAEGCLDNLKNHVISTPYVHISRSLFETMMLIDEQKKMTVDFTGLNTGFNAVNKATHGWQKKNLIIVAARPAVGKTAFVLNTALKCAADKKNGCPVGIFNLEMSKDEINKRLLSCISGVVLDKLNAPKTMTPTDSESLDKAVSVLAKLPIMIDDSAGLHWSELRMKARRMKSKDGVGLIVIDYLQLLQILGFNSNREQEVSTLSRNLKKLAKELDIPIIALSQLNRASDKEDRDPELSDLRESGAIEQDADLVMFLYRLTEKKLKIKGNEHLRNYVLGAIKKNRHGACTNVKFYVDNFIQRWLDEQPVLYSASPGMMTDNFTADPDQDLPF